MNKTEIVTLTTADNNSMQAYVAFPEGGGTFPGLMLFQEAFGVNGHIESLCDFFASKGYITIAPELYHRTADSGFTVGYDEIEAVALHRAAMTYETIADDIKTTYEWLVEHEAVDSKRVASIGYCMGGRVSYFASMVVPVSASISYYGGGIANDLLDRTGEVAAPVLFFWGGKDVHIPRADRTKLLESLDQYDKKYINVELSDAGHGFACDERQSYNQDATHYAQELTLSFLKTNLR